LPRKLNGTLSAADGDIQGAAHGVQLLCAQSRDAFAEESVKTLAIEFAPHNITANAIVPGAVRTPMMFENDALHTLFRPDLENPQTADREEAIMAALHKLPTPWIQPEDVSELAVFLAGDKGRYISGTAIDVTAGSSADRGCDHGRSATAWTVLRRVRMPASPTVAVGGAALDVALDLGVGEDEEALLVDRIDERSAISAGVDMSPLLVKRAARETTTLSAPDAISTVHTELGDLLRSCDAGGGITAFPRAPPARFTDS
jgi:hypothetical protein